MNISRQCAHKWWRRYQTRAWPGWRTARADRTRCPHQTPARVERRIVALRQSRKLGPARLAGIVGVPASTVHRVLVRHGVNRLRWMDRPTGRVIRRIETTRCGELVHIDVKKLARVPHGGGHKMRGRAVTQNRTGAGLHPHPHRHRRPLPARLQRVRRHREHRQLRRLPAPRRRLVRRPRHHRSNGSSPTTATATASIAWAAALRRARHQPLPHPALPARHQRQGRTLQPHPARRMGLRPALDAQTPAEPAALDRWLHRYNHHRHHTAIGGPPASRVTNLASHNS